jgi:histone H3/H4
MYEMANENSESRVITSKDSITKHAISRLARIAGVKALSGLIYEELRIISVAFLEDVLSKAIDITEHSRRRTLSREDVLEGLRLENYPVGTGQESSKEHCKIYVSPPAIKEIKFYQPRFGDRVHIPKLVVERVVKEIGGQQKSALKYEADAIGILHFALESYLVKLLQDAQLVAIHAKRESVQPKDVHLVITLRTLQII